MKHTNAVGVAMHDSSFGLQMMQWKLQSQPSGTRGALDKSAGAAIQRSCNFLTWVVGVNFSGWKEGGKMRKAWLSRSTVCTFRCYLILILAAADERPLRWGIRARKMSAAPETLVCRYLRTGQHIWLGAIGELYQHAMQLLISQKIDPRY